MLFQNIYELIQWLFYDQGMQCFFSYKNQFCWEICFKWKIVSLKNDVCVSWMFSWATWAYTWYLTLIIFTKHLTFEEKKNMLNSLLTVKTYNIFTELQFSLQYIHYLNSLFYRFSTILKHWVIVNALKLYRHVLSFFISYWNNSLF